MPVIERERRALREQPTGLHSIPSQDGQRQKAVVRGLTAARPMGATRALREFVHNEASSGILLLVCAVLALVWANSPWGDAYAGLWTTKLTIGTDRFRLTESLQHWVNDGLMTLFFLVVGLEIKRQLVAGELASPRRAALPAIAALGGVLVPAAIYVALNAGTVGAKGWGVPMATDIAFALGILVLIGDRVPVALKVFLTALAIVDDIAAVLVIALFYTGAVSWTALGVAATLLAVLIGANRLDVRQPLVYLLVGLGLWLAILESGVHATVAGVLLALTIPARSRSGRQPGKDTLRRIEHALSPWVAFAIVPLFALANAGVRFEGDFGTALGNRVTLGVVLGLVIGKQVGITLFTYVAARAGLARLPDGVTWQHLYGVSWLAGIGFTMSLFVTELAFGSTGQSELMTSAKFGILAASLLAGVGGWRLLVRADRGARRSAPAVTIPAEARWGRAEFD